MNKVTTNRRSPGRDAVLLLALTLLFGCQRVAAQVTEPAVEPGADGPVLVLPPSLETAIQESFPDVRVPGQRNLVGGWATEPTATTLPFAAIGDFDGNNLSDVALFLLRVGSWRLVSFHQTEPGVWVAHTLRGFPGPNPTSVKQPPQTFRLQLIPADEPLVLGDVIVERNQYVFDTIAAFDVQDDTSAITWRFKPDRNRFSVRRVGPRFVD